MSDTLVPSKPSDVMVIRDVTPNVVTLSVPFLRFGKIPVGGRGTIVRLSTGALAVFSPVALTPEVKAKLAELGNNLLYIVAPDIEHHIFVSDWKAAFPAAKLICVDGLPEKRAGQNDPKIGKETFDVVFKPDNKRTMSISPDFDHDFEYEYMDGHANKELVFFYKPDHVLIEADLLFNLPATEQYSRVPDEDRPKPGFLARQFMGLQTTQGDVKGLKRLIWYALSRPNRPSFDDSIKRISTWDFSIIVPCHGDVIEEGAKETFEKVFDWHLHGRK